MIPHFCAALAVFCAGRWYCELRKQREEQRILAREKHEKIGLVYPHIFKLAWFIIVVVYEWRNFSKHPWFPKFLGGTQVGLFDDDTGSQLEIFYAVQLAYHLHSMLFSFIVGSKFEMHLHHFVTILLIVGSSLTGFRRSGSIVFMLHDTPDIVGCAIKASVIAGGVFQTLSLYVALLIVWGYFRLYLLPSFIVEVIDADLSQSAKIGFGSLLATLVVLHAFWYVQFLLMGFNFRKSGKTRDISEKTAHPSDLVTTSKTKKTANMDPAENDSDSGNSDDGPEEQTKKQKKTL